MSSRSITIKIEVHSCYDRVESTSAALRWPGTDQSADRAPRQRYW